jgi:urease accessory protein
VIPVRPAPCGNWTIGKHALLSLRATPRRERTALDCLARRTPYQFQGVHYQDHDDQPFLLLHNSAGGYVEGDVADLIVEADAGTRTLLTTMGATKFYKCLDGGVAAENVVVRVGERSLMEYLPDEVIPYADSNVVRTTLFEISPTSRLFATDILAAGRIHYAGGEAFAFSGVRSELELRVNGRSAFLDRITAAGRDVRALQRLWHGLNLYGTVLVYSDQLPAGIEATIEETCRGLGLIAGASRRGQLICVRLLAAEAWQMHEAILGPEVLRSISPPARGGSH